MQHKIIPETLTIPGPCAQGPALRLAVDQEGGLYKDLGAGTVTKIHGQSTLLMEIQLPKPKTIKATWLGRA